MRDADPYNSALKGPVWPGREQLSEIDFAESERGMVFAHNVIDPLPDDKFALILTRADCIYSELPWPAAREAFYHRAGIEARPHGDLVFAIKARIVNPLGKPTYIVAAKHDAHFLSGAEPQPIMHRGSPAWLAIVNAPAPPPCKTTLDVLEWLGATYRSVYDFTCGYGRSLRYFHYAIGSDIDRKCLAYAAGHILGGEGEIKSQLNP